jgi:hypothetical protein
MGEYVHLFVGPKRGKALSPKQFKSLANDLMKQRIVYTPAAVLEGGRELAAEANVPSFLAGRISEADSKKPPALPKGTKFVYRGERAAKVMSALSEGDFKKVICVWFCGLNEDNKKLTKAGLGDDFYNVDILLIASPTTVKFQMYSEDWGGDDFDPFDEDGEEVEEQEPDDDFSSATLTGMVHYRQCLIFTGSGGLEPRNLRGNILGQLCHKHFGPRLQVGCTYA